MAIPSLHNKLVLASQEGIYLHSINFALVMQASHLRGIAWYSFSIDQKGVKAVLEFVPTNSNNAGLLTCRKHTVKFGSRLIENMFAQTQCLALTTLLLITNHTKKESRVHSNRAQRAHKGSKRMAYYRPHWLLQNPTCWSGVLLSLSRLQKMIRLPLKLLLDFAEPDLLEISHHLQPDPLSTQASCV